MAAHTNAHFAPQYTQLRSKYNLQNNAYPFQTCIHGLKNEEKKSKNCNINIKL